MQADNLTRVLLLAILACLLLLLVQRGGGGGSVPAPEAATAARFEVRPVPVRRGAPLLLRIDTATGQAWRMGLMDAPRWVPLAEGETGAPAAGAEVPGRFSIEPHQQPSRGAPTLVRSDALTGSVWRKGSKDNRPWVPVPNPDPGATPPAAGGAKP